MKDREEFVTGVTGYNCKCMHDEWYHRQWYNPSNLACEICDCQKLDIIEKARTGGTELERATPDLGEVTPENVEWRYRNCGNELEVCKFLSEMKLEYASAAKVFKEYSEFSGNYFIMLYPYPLQVKP